MIVIECVSRLRPYTPTIDGKLVDYPALEKIAATFQREIDGGSDRARIFEDFDRKRMVGRVFKVFVDRRGIVTWSRIGNDVESLRHFMTGGLRVLPKYDYLKTRVTVVGAISKDLDRDGEDSFRLLDGAYKELERGQ